VAGGPRDRATIASFIVPWAGAACRHIPDDSPYGVLDTRFAGRARTNRWNRPGEPTFYLAGDHALLVAEFARHLRDDAGLEAQRVVQARRIYDIAIELARVVDLRDHRIHELLALRDAPTCFLDREIARATAGFLRRATNAEAILVPSVAFLDDPTRWVLVLFLEKLTGGLESVVRAVERDGALRIGP
jgi:RES domain-containing protein